jgi:RNA-directed DNA polymerase
VVSQGIKGKAMSYKPLRQGVEKSDALVVPTKRANKGEQSAAERVEGSGAKARNAILQSTDRTQSRVAVSQAQERIREAVKRFRVNHST